ncbi:hypothetical protein AGMMS4956_21360 [Bacteroidia bacterium]|nr:hypothetical protein AGMMS4956_21360 [Bacteroidia bacterium]
MSSFSEIKGDTATEGEAVQFSVVQKNKVEDEKETLEKRARDYEEGQKRLEHEEVYVSSTSFGSAFKQKTKPAAEKEVAEVVPQSAPVQQNTYNNGTPVAPKRQKQAQTTATTARAATSASATEPTAQTQPQQQEVRSKRTRFTDEAEAAAAAQANRAASNGAISFKARIFEDVEIINSANVKVRVLEDFTIDGCLIKHNTLLSAVAQRSSRSVDIMIQSIMACGKRVTVRFTGYTADGVQGLPVREDNAAEIGTREGGNEMATGTAEAVAARSSGVLGIIGAGVAGGVRSGTRAAQQRQPVLVEEGRELIFMTN